MPTHFLDLQQRIMVLLLIGFTRVSYFLENFTCGGVGVDNAPHGTWIQLAEGSCGSPLVLK